jgi:16S rRNA (cytidine1402-2'-O)-methyltransferase
MNAAVADDADADPHPGRVVPAALAEMSPWREAGLAEQQFPPGLYVVATPLGNAADVSLRALWILRLVDCVAAEDTRTTAPLLARYGITARLLALHQHNEAERAGAIVQRLARGERVALVTDAGTPAISDPGALLVRAALDAGARVIPVPGASSMTAALCVAGVRSAAVQFLGFPPGRLQARRRWWRSLAAADGAAVVFDAPHRIVQTAQELHDAFEPQRRIVVARELTKKFESVLQTTAAQLPQVLAAAPPRGEYVLVIDAPAGAHERAGADDAGAPEVAQVDPVTARWLLALAEQMPASRAAAIGAKASGLPRELLYRFLGRGADVADTEEVNDVRDIKVAKDEGPAQR